MIRGLDEELRAHKYSHVERERRFLVDPARLPDLAGADVLLIEDRYILGTRLRLRRMTDLASGRVVLKLTKKYAVENALARPMVTAYLDQAEFDLIASLPAEPLVKRRHRVPTASGEFGVDRFEGALDGLWLAEMEAASDSELAAVAAPPWTIAEVSNDPLFEGGHLATLQPGSLAALLSGRR